MYKIVLVDDEQIVREGIAGTIDWTSLGFELAGAYENGADADRAIDSIAPSVVITDICMPFSDGLELTEQIAKKHPETKVILLSGFDEFQYAQRAIRLGAYDYVLKPITAIELSTLLDRVRADLDEQLRRTEELAAISKTLERTRETRLSALTERLLRDALPGHDLIEEEIVLALRAAGIELPTGRGAVLALCTDDIERGTERSHDGTIEELEHHAPGSFLDHAHRRIAVVACESDEKCSERARSAARSILALADAQGVTVTAGIGSTFDGPGSFAASYREAVCCLEYRFVAGVGRSIEHADVPPGACHRSELRAPAEGEWSSSFRSSVSDIVRALRACDASEAASSIGRLVAEIRKDFVSRARCDLQIHSCLVAINELAAEIGRPPLSIDAVASLPTIDAVERLLDETCTAIIQAQVEHGVTFGETKAREAVEHIEQHYIYPSLSLTSLCTAIGVSPSYFSTVFKHHTGKTFVEYLTEVRVDNAKKLLKTTDLRIYEVARRVGYRDHHYFCTIFKKSSGRSPLEFRRAATVPQT